MEASAAEFVRAHTTLGVPPFLPELRLHLAADAFGLWEETERSLGVPVAAPPFWAFPWAGGQALARHVLDHPAVVAGRRGPRVPRPGPGRRGRGARRRPRPGVPAPAPPRRGGRARGTGGPGAGGRGRQAGDRVAAVLTAVLTAVVPPIVSRRPRRGSPRPPGRPRPRPAPGRRPPR